MRIAGERKIGKIGEGFGASFRGDDGRAHVAAQNLRHFEIDQVRRMERLADSEDQLVYMPGCGRSKENFQNSGSVDNDQRLSLSARTAAAGTGRGRIGWRPDSRLRISSTVGRSSA